MYTIQFSDISKNDIKTVGGKGASLGEMFNAMLPVPDGFVISVETFKSCLIDNDVYEKINNMISQLKVDDIKLMQKVSNNIQNIIFDIDISFAIQEAIKEQFRFLNMSYVAVRSSATSEDSAFSAWAGQLDSYLNVNEDTLIGNIKKCWASLFSERALFYRLKRQDNKEISIAVIVQKMVQSDIAGVAFSIDPVNNNRNVIVIEAALGLGEAVVSGSVSPDNYVLEKDSFEILEKNIKEKSKDRDNLTNNKILELSKLVLNIEKYYGFPVDIEWAIEDNIIYIVQCRPITTYNDAVEFINKIESVGKWYYDLTMEFSWFVINSTIEATKRSLQIKELGFTLPFVNCVYVNGDQYLACESQSGDSLVLEKYFEEDIEFFDKMQNKKLEVCANSKRCIKHMQGLKLDKLSNEELASEFKKFAYAYSLSLALCWTRPYDYLECKLKQVLKNELKLSEEELIDVLNKIATNPNCYEPLCYSEEPLNLLYIAKHPKEEWQLLLKGHMEKYSWMKAPLLAEGVHFTEEEYVSRLEFLTTIDIDKKITEILKIRENNDKEYEDVLKKYNFSKRGLALARAVRNNVYMHTNTAERSDELLFRGRQTLIKEIARRTNISIGNLMMLSSEEIETITRNGKAISNMDSIIKERSEVFCVIWIKEKIEILSGKKALEIYNFFRKNVKNEEFLVKETSNNIQIKGAIANKGKVIGKVKILLDYKDIGKVEAGDIIVTPMTTPDFVAAMEKSSGVITDAGGITCHAAILTREFNVPCIVGTNNATDILEDGQLVELDAYKGIVNIIEENLC